MNRRQASKGFTIIEVVLVLAIAGLIFLMVLFALPTLNRNQRDSARKSEVGTVTGAITSYMGNNRNTIPTGAQIGSYITGNNSATLESGTNIIVRTTSFGGDITLSANLPGAPSTGDNTLYADQIKVYFGYKCDADNASQIVRGTAKQSAVTVALESGPSTGSVYCQTN